MAFAYKPHKKQVAAHRAFLQDGFKRGVLLFGRQCLDGDTLVATETGHKRIADIQVGDRVLSRGKKLEYKSVIDTMSYWVDTDPKPMIEFRHGKDTIKCTYDHPFKVGSEYVPVYQLAWRSMASSQRQKLELLCEQYGQTIDYESSWLKGEDSGDETSSRQVRVSQDGSGRKNRKITQVGSPDLVAKSREQRLRQSQERNQGRQSSEESGMEYIQRELATRYAERAEGEQAGRKLRDFHFNRKTGQRYANELSAAYLQSVGIKVQSQLLYGVGHYQTSHLDTHLITDVVVSKSAETYAIEVEDNHNYFITEQNLEVQNTGKTFFSVHHALLAAFIRQGRYFIVFSTYKQAKEVVWRQYISLIPQEVIYKKNEQDLLIEFHYLNGPVKMPDGTVIQVEHDQSKPRSTLQLLGSDQADSHRGFRADGIIFDEYGDQDPNNFKEVYEPMFSTTDGWAVFMGTPRGYNHFYDLIQFARDDERWFYLEATWRDSPYVKREFIEEVRAEAEKRGMLSGFMQEYELEFRSVQGAVYPTFNRKVHVVNPNEIPEDLTIYVGIDFGYHTTACLFVGIDHDQNWYVFDEVYGRETILQDLIPRIRDKLAGKRLVLMVGDSQAKDAIQTMIRDFPIVPVVKRTDSIIHGIDLIRTKLKPRIQLIGRPKPTLFISSVCKNLIQEMEQYKYPEDKVDRNPSELPVKENDHGPDALRYLVLHLRYGVQKDDKLPPAPRFNDYGLPVY